MHFATITAQGQISIPAKIRRMLELDKTRKVILEVRNKQVVITPVSDFDELAGSLSEYGKQNKGLTKEEIIEKENKAISEAAIERYKKSS